jgi:hypothetical protein
VAFFRITPAPSRFHDMNRSLTPRTYTSFERSCQILCGNLCEKNFPNMLKRAKMRKNRESKELTNSTSHAIRGGWKTQGQSLLISRLQVRFLYGSPVNGMGWLQTGQPIFVSGGRRGLPSCPGGLSISCGPYCLAWSPRLAATDKYLFTYA